MEHRFTLNRQIKYLVREEELELTLLIAATRQVWTIKLNLSFNIEILSISHLKNTTEVHKKYLSIHSANAIQWKDR